MLERLKIKNFQSHKLLDIEFDKRVTTIVGPSDVGKSAIIRAIQWVIQNKPTGEAFITYGQDKSVVRLECDGNKIVRIRGKGKNTYKLNDEIYTAFGNETPETITKLLNISDINFQTQHASPFWFNETAGEVSRQLNTIVNLDIIDTTLANIASEIKQQRTTVNIIENRITNIKNRIDELSYIKEKDKDFENIEEIDTKLEKTHKKSITLSDILSDIESHSNISKTHAKIVKIGNDALEKGKIYKEKHDKLVVLNRLIEQITGYQQIVDNSPPSIIPLQKIYDKSINISKKRNGLSSLITKIADYQATIDRETKNIKDLKKQIKESIGDVCPLCNQPVH